MKQTLILLCILAFVAGCGKPKVGHPEQSANAPAASALFYYSDRDTVYRFDPDSLTRVKVFWGYDACVSNDGKLIAFTEDTAKLNANEWARYISIYDVATRASHRLRSIKGRDSFNAQFSPDGRTLVFDHYDTASSNWYIARVSADDTDFRILTAKHGVAFTGYFQPSWMSDGSGFICHDLDTAYEFSPDGRLLAQIPMKQIVPIVEYGMSSSSHIFSDPIHHRIVAEAGSDMEEDSTIEHYGIFVYDTQTKQSKQITPDTLHAWDPHWVEAKHSFYFRGYTSKDLAATPSTGDHPDIAWRMYAVGADGTGLRMVYDPAKR